MPINTQLLISAPMLQDPFVDDATGLALSAGVITCYQDNSRTTLKNWYYQTGSPGNYTYITLPNPMTLTSAGTISDGSGNDVIPFFYPFSEVDNLTSQPYYITVANSNGQQQFVRQNFPFLPSSGSSSSAVPTLSNLITNNEFWRNAGTVVATNPSIQFKLNGSILYSSFLCPSQHDGYTDQSDIQFIKDAQGAIDTLTFKNFVIGAGSFPDQIIGSNDITPEFYLNMNCSSTGTETTKYIQIPIQLHVTSLSGVKTASFVIDAMAVSGAPSITLKLFQFLGTGVTSPSPIVLRTIALSNTWEKYIVQISAETAFPSAQGLTLGAGGDDAFFLQIGFPTGSVGGTYNINIAKPAVYLSSTVPTNDFETYDKVNSIICSPRTGDIRTSLNSYYPNGWVPMNNGTICNSGSITAPNGLALARSNIDAWPLFNLIWNLFASYNNGTTNLLAQLYDSTGAAVAYGVNAITDWSANKQISLTKTIGKVLLGTVPNTETLSPIYGTNFSASNSGGNLLCTSAYNNPSLFNGMPIYFTTPGTLPTGLVVNTIYYIANFNGTNAFNISTSFGNALAGTVITFTDSGSGLLSFQTALAGSYEGEYAHTQLLAELAAHTHPPLTGTHFITDGATASGGTGASWHGDVTTGITGSSMPFNVTQPSVFMNMFIKL